MRWERSPMWATAPSHSQQDDDVDDVVDVVDVVDVDVAADNHDSEMMMLMHNPKVTSQNYD